MLVTALVPIFTLAQDDAEQTREQIEKLERDIARITREIDLDSAERNKVQETLRAADLELGRVQRAITDNQKVIQDKEAELAGLEAQKAELDAAATTQQDRIAQEMKTAWQMGRESQLKMLLSQQAPENVARSMEYYRFGSTWRFRGKTKNDQFHHTCTKTTLTCPLSIACVTHSSP